MAIIVAGRLFVQPEQRARFLAGSRSAMELARRTEGCADFVVAPDPLDPSRVNVFELWRSRKALLAFRESGPDDGLSALIQRAEAGNDYRITVDLEAQKINDSAGFSVKFEVDPFRRDCLLRGLDDIGLTLEKISAIDAYEKAHS